MKSKIHRFHTIIVGAGAAGMNCAVHLYEELTRKGIQDAQKGIVVLSRGVKLGASRMSGSDKQTYYKMGTSPETADSAKSFAQSLTAAGCCHEDLALIEGIGSLAEFFHLVRSGVPFPCDKMGSFVGYKTDHDPYERATSAGPKTSKFMSECLTAEVRRYGVAIHDQQEVVTLLTAGSGSSKRIVGVVTLDAGSASRAACANVYYCDNLVLAAGGPGEMYKTSVYPRGQVGLHGLALEASLAAENLTESQFGLASIAFRWNVSGTYMQVIPRIYSTDANGGGQREFLADAFPSMSKMATDIFLKGYQWPFAPQRIANYQSSLVDVLVFNETQKGRRVWMDFLRNPIGTPRMKKFALADLEGEAIVYLKNCGATQARPIDRLHHMNPLAIDIYTEHGIDLWKEPLEIALCAQHNNGGLGVNVWWESNIPHTFVIGEMAGTHGVKRPGGSALNSGQTGGLRAAMYIANVYAKPTLNLKTAQAQTKSQVAAAMKRLTQPGDLQARYTPQQVIEQIQERMTACGGHIRQRNAVEGALADAISLCEEVRAHGFVCKAADRQALRQAVVARHMALASVAYLKAIKELLLAGLGSRGSYLVIDNEGILAHPSVLDPRSGKPLRMKPENEALRRNILRLQYDPQSAELFQAQTIAPRQAPESRKSFELAWADYREGKIFAP